MQLATLTSHVFDSNIRARGDAYYRQGSVSHPKVTNNKATLTVEGSRRYRVTLDWRDAAERGRISLICTCPHYEDGNFCKHCWAAILELDREGISEQIPAGPKPTRLEVIHEYESYGDPYDEGDEDEDDEIDKMTDDELNAEIERVLDSRASRSTPQKPQPPRKSDWLQKLDLIKEAGKTNSTRPQTSSKPRSCYYVLDLDKTRQTGQITVSFYHRETLRSGTQGQLKHQRISHDDLGLYTDPLDRELIATLIGPSAQLYGQHTTYYSGYSSPTSAHHSMHFNKGVLPTSIQNELLAKLAQTGRFLLQDTPTALTFNPNELWRVELDVIEVAESADLEVTAFLKHEDRRIPIQEPVLLLSSGIIIFQDHLAPFQDVHHFPWVALMRGSGDFRIPRAECDRFIETICEDALTPPIHWPASLAWPQIKLEPKPRAVFLSAPQHSAYKGFFLDLEFDYEGRKILASTAAASATTLLDREQRRIILRDLDQEQRLFKQLSDIDGINSAALPQGSLRVLSRDFSRISNQILSWGWPVIAQGKLVRKSGEFKLSVASGVDWFDLKAEIPFGDGFSVSLLEAMEAMKNGLKWITLGDGSLGMLPDHWLKKYAHLASMGSANSQGIRFTRAQGAILSAWLAEEPDLKSDHDFHALQGAIQSFANIKPLAPPKTFKGKLRDYQKDGLGWLGALRASSLGGIMADDMGLGKTVQVLAHLDGEKLRLKGSRPSLVILPKSLLFNWQEEAARFTPKLKVVCYAGVDRGKCLKQIPTSDLVLVTYSTLRQDLEALRAFDYHYVIADEAQAIKNSESLSHRACRLIRASHRLALTGTPVENSLTDLFAILDFACPGLLGTETQTRLGKAGQIQNLDAEALKRLSQALKPFILRRTKDQVLKELPEKTEKIIHCELSPTEKKVYDELRDYYRASLKGEIARRGIARSKIMILEALLRLRQAACHPDLISKKTSNRPSAKTETLMAQLDEILAEGHKALVFSQFTSFLDIVRKALEQKKIAYAYIDGSVSAKERQKQIAQFRDDSECKIFLISLKAGGVGLNLTAADYVFILDPWWNPAVESQAIDRAHRIGQKNKVIAYRLIAKGTVEEKIVELQQSKRKLADAIITADVSLLKSLTSEEVEWLLS